MEIVTQVSSEIPKKHIRRIKYKLYKLQEKFKKLISTHLYIQTEGSRYKTYNLKLVLSVPGPDVVIALKGDSLESLIEKGLKNCHRLLSELRYR